MTVSKTWLEAKIKELNEWLQNHQQNQDGNYVVKEHSRNYYVNKLIELDESGAKNIKLYDRQQA